MGRSRGEESGAPRRAERLEEICLREADLLVRSLEDPRLDSLAVWSAELSRDLSRLRLVCVPTREPAFERLEVETALSRAAPFMRFELAATLGLKKAPIVTIKYSPDLTIGVAEEA